MLLLKLAIDKKSWIISEMRDSTSISVELVVVEGLNSCLSHLSVLPSDMSAAVISGVIKVVCRVVISPLSNCFPDTTRCSIHSHTQAQRPHIGPYFLDISEALRLWTSF